MSKVGYVKVGMLVLLGVGLVMFYSQKASSHCDTLDGPVVSTARQALEKGDVTPVLKWVKPEYEAEIREVFKKTLAVRTKGTEAKELADMYFFETLVRLHRAGEGAPFTGLKSAAESDLSPAVVKADKALATGSVNDVVKMVTDAAAEGIRERFNNVIEKKKHADESVDAGREYVEAYVVFVHYVEDLHNMIEGASAHQGEADKTGTGESQHKHK